MRKIPYRVTAGVLSAIMLAASMPIADADVFAAQTNMESTANDNGSTADIGATEETENDLTEAAEESETEETSEATEENAEDTEGIEDTEETKAGKTGEEVSEETEIVADDTTYTLGTGDYAKELAPATYSVPMKMFKFTTDTSKEGYFENDSNKSMAGSCVSEPASVIIHEDGTATVTVKLGTVSFAGAQGFGSEWSVYQDYDAARTGLSTVTRIAAQIDAYSRVTGGEEKYASQITFKLPQTDRNGAYVHMYIEAMGSWQDALFAMSWKDATKTSDETSATSTIDGEAVGGNYLASIGSTTYDNIDTAIAALTDGKTLKLNGNVKLTKEVTVAGGNIELNGYSLDVNDQTVTLAGNTIISDGSTDKSGSVVNSGKKMDTAIKVQGNITLNGITDSVYLTQSGENSALVIEKSNLTGVITYQTGNMTVRDTVLNGKMNINGGSDGQILLDGANKFTADKSYEVISAEYDDEGGLPATIIINDGTYVTGGEYAIEAVGKLVQVNGGCFKAGKNAILGGYQANGKRIALVTGGTYDGYFAPQEVSASNAWDYAVKVYNADGTLAGGLESDGVDGLVGLLQDGQTAVLEKDITPNECFKTSVNATIDLNGHTIDGETKELTPLIQVTDKTLRMEDTSEGKTGVLKTYRDEDVSSGGVVCTALATEEGASPVLYLDQVNTYGSGLATFVNGKVIVRGGYHDHDVVGFYVTTATLDIGESTWSEAAETGEGANDYGKLSAKIRKVRYSLEKNENGTYSVVGTDLGKALEKAEKITEQGCTAASWASYGEVFEKAYQNALEITSDSEETEVQSAVAALNTAMDNLVMAASKATFESLNTAIISAKAIDAEKYTTESYQNVQTAIKTAEDAISARASETDVKTALDALNAAINALVVKPAETKPEETKPADTETTSTDETQTKEVTAPSSMKAESTAYNQVKLTWKAGKNAAGYEVYQKTGKKFKKIATVKTTSYTVKKLTTGTKYTFKVRAYGTVDGEKTYSGYTKTVSAKPVPAAPKKIAVKNSAKKTAKLSWKKVAGADGYEVYRANTEKGKFKKIATGKSGKSISYTNKKLSKNKTYYYKVRAYKNVNGKKVYGAYSQVVKVKIKK